MKLATEITTETPKEIAYFDFLSMEITPGGLLVKGKSPLFAPWVEEQVPRTAVGRPSTWTHSGQTLYAPPDAWSYQKPWGFAQVSQIQYFSDDKPNLLWLFHPKLAEGFELLIKQPISLNNWEDYFTTCCRAVQEIYTRELRQACISARFKEVFE